jgi:hypothetical protein
MDIGAQWDPGMGVRRSFEVGALEGRCLACIYALLCQIHVKLNPGAANPLVEQCHLVHQL